MKRLIFEILFLIALIFIVYGFYYAIDRYLIQPGEVARQQRLIEYEENKKSCYDEGFAAAKKGIPCEACQYPNVSYSPSRQAWMKGWQEGKSK